MDLNRCSVRLVSALPKINVTEFESERLIKFSLLTIVLDTKTFFMFLYLHFNSFRVGVVVVFTSSQIIFQNKVFVLDLRQPCIEFFSVNVETRSNIFVKV